MADDADRRLLDAVRAALDEHDPVPDAVVGAARGSLSWLTIDAELAALAEDSALAATGVRSTDTSRVLTFECETGVIVLEVTEADGGRRMVGQLDRPARLSIRHPGGQLDLDTDEHGRFQADGITAGAVSLRCVFVDAPDRPVVTSWVLV